MSLDLNTKTQFSKQQNLHKGLLQVSKRSRYMQEVEAACQHTRSQGQRKNSTHVHACLLTHVPAHTCACSHVCLLTDVPANMCTCSYACLFIYMPTHTRARSHTFLLTHMPAYTRTCSLAYCAQLDSVTHTIQNPCLRTGTAHRGSNPHTSAN